ncbi:MAG: chemotaxis protein CheX [Planctomycetaceae bacterium]|nr:chemotaxis protein CheX [Planctomycetaceae bacterium]
MAMATVADDPFASLGLDTTILKAIVDAVDDCLTMCDANAKCVGTSTVPMADPGTVTGMIGIHGNVSGFITVNMAEKVAMSAVGGLLQDQFTQLDAQVIDGVGEMTNIISGGIKNGLAGTHWQFSHVTVPSVIVGRNYQIAYAKGLEFLAVTFEHDNVETFLLDDRLLKVAVSMLRL